jgi:hypothetical protein
MDSTDENLIDALESLSRARAMHAAFPEHASVLDAVIARQQRVVARAVDAIVERDARDVVVDPVRPVPP